MRGSTICASLHLLSSPSGLPDLDLLLHPFRRQESIDSPQLVELRQQIEVLYNKTITQSRKKQLGQFFTPPTISALACAAALTTTTTKVIDPMVGTGSMLWAAVEYARTMKLGRDIQFTGVEIDRFASILATLPSIPCHLPYVNQVEIHHDDAFLHFLKSASRVISDKEQYDAVVGNPPYIRYQNLGALYEQSNPAIMGYLQKLLPDTPKSSLAGTLIRACLISSVLDRNDDVSALLGQAVEFLYSRASWHSLTEIDQLWLQLVTGYSGLADLSLPAWLLTWQLAKPGATIALVVTNSAKTRQYARFLRYFLLRFLQPILTIEQEGSWFTDALVSTSLMVFRKRDLQDVLVPLQDRKRTDHIVRRVQIASPYNLAVLRDFQDIARQISPELRSDSDCGLGIDAHAITEAISSVETDVANVYWNVQILDEMDLYRELMNEDQASQYARSYGVPLQQFEYGTSYRSLTRANSTSKIEVDKTSVSHLQPPLEIMRAFEVNATRSTGFVLPIYYQIQVNQGVRTGCNPFFYLEIPTNEDISRLLGSYTREDVGALFASSKEADLDVLLERLQSSGVIVDAHQFKQSPESQVLIKLSKEFGSELAVFPKSVLQKVIRYQGSHLSWRIDESAAVDYILAVAHGTTLEDFRALAKFPELWLHTWEQRDGLYVLSKTVNEYIERGARTTLVRNGKAVLIPQLSAVSPNAREPKITTSMVSQQSIPACPSWWYSLTLKPRHYGDLFIARVVDYAPQTYLNNDVNPLVIDANFSTISIGTGTISRYALLALFNSIWFKTVLEIICTPMGGGALKVEAADLRNFPMPILDPQELATLDNLGKRLADASRLNNLDISQEIDLAVAAIVGKRLGTEPSQTNKALENLLVSYRDRRRGNSALPIHLRS